MTDSHFLSGQLLVAMPGMQDPNFDHTVTLLFDHTADGAVGVVINRPMPLDIGTVLRQLNIKATPRPMLEQAVLFGGPVQPERGCVVHTAARTWDATTAIGDAICITSSADILSAVAGGEGPEQLLLTLGYAGWGPGQLEAEILQNAWLTAPATTDIVFSTPYELRWQAATRSLGIDPASLSTQAGHA